ncbi:MAG: hypothetical protein LW862_20270 [Rubrivivax sp.]|jgi:hypothetical protein|nr:hypothetical protein [Rubrivivax sp.]
MTRAMARSCSDVWRKKARLHAVGSVEQVAQVVTGASRRVADIATVTMMEVLKLGLPCRLPLGIKLLLMTYIRGVMI